MIGLLWYGLLIIILNHLDPFLAHGLSQFWSRLLCAHSRMHLPLPFGKIDVSRGDKSGRHEAKSGGGISGALESKAVIILR